MIASAFSKMVFLVVAFGLLSVFAPELVYVTGSHPSISVRLARGATANTGLLEVRYNNKWGLVCNEGWDNKDLAVVCRMLDYPGVKEHKSTTFSPINCGSWLVTNNCTGRESSLNNCTNNGWKPQHFCMIGEYVVLTCKTFR